MQQLSHVVSSVKNSPLSEIRPPLVIELIDQVNDFVNDFQAGASAGRRQQAGQNLH